MPCHNVAGAERKAALRVPLRHRAPPSPCQHFFILPPFNPTTTRPLLYTNNLQIFNVSKLQPQTHLFTTPHPQPSKCLSPEGKPEQQSSSVCDGSVAENRATCSKCIPSRLSVLIANSHLQRHHQDHPCDHPTTFGCFPRARLRC